VLEPAVEVARDHVRLEYQYARVLVIVGYPRSVTPGWLTPLLEFEHPIEISLHIHPLETAAIVKLLGDRRLARRMGARGQEHAQLFSMPTFTRSVEALVQSLLTRPGP